MRWLGIDVSLGVLDICRKRGVKNVQQLPFHKVDVSLDTLGTFETVLMMGNNFGLFANPRRAKWMLRRLKKLTSWNARNHSRWPDMNNTPARRDSSARPLPRVHRLLVRLSHDLAERED